MLSFASLQRALDTVPIRGCEGRYLVRGVEQVTVEALVGAPVAVLHRRSPHAKDPILIVRFPDGGLISYHRPDGSYVHTLCDAGGFARKLAQLGIALK
jgi:hypothetical protein